MKISRLEEDKNIEENINKDVRNLFRLKKSKKETNDTALNPFALERSIYGSHHLNTDIFYVVYHCCFMRYRSRRHLFDEVRKPKN